MNDQQRIENIIANLKSLVPSQLDTDDYKATYDTAIQFALDKAIDDCLIYTNLKQFADLSTQLDRTIVMMAMDLIVDNQLVTPLADKVNPNVAALTEGDTSVTFKTPAEVANLVATSDSLARSYKAKLNHFRVVKR